MGELHFVEDVDCRVEDCRILVFGMAEGLGIEVRMGYPRGWTDVTFTTGSFRVARWTMAWKGVPSQNSAAMMREALSVQRPA